MALEINIPQSTEEVLKIALEVEEEGFDSVAFSWKLLKEKGVCVVPGTAFGDYPAFMRLSACIDIPLIKEGIRRMGDLLG